MFLQTCVKGHWNCYKCACSAPRNKMICHSTSFETIIYPLLTCFVPNCDFLLSPHYVTQHSHYSPHQSNMPGRFHPVFINQLRATWHSTELLTCSLCLTDTEQRAIHNCRTHPRSAVAACKSPVNPESEFKPINKAH